MDLHHERFTLEYGFLVLMGGISIPDVEKLTDDPNFPRTLTSHGVLSFARNGVFFDVPLKEIVDKSKADTRKRLDLFSSYMVWHTDLCATSC